MNAARLDDRDDEVRKSRGIRIREARSQANLTQQALADKTPFSKSMIAQWETGLRRPGVDALWELSRVLGASFAWLAVGETSLISSEEEAGFHQGGWKYNSVLLQACAETIVGFVDRNNIPMAAANIPSLIDDLYQRSANQGLDLKTLTREEMASAIQAMARLRLVLAP